MTKKPTPDDKDNPRIYPSVPDAEAEPGKLDEPDIEVGVDRVPETGFELPRTTSSRAELRLHVERLLSRREAASPEAWAELGDDGRTLVVELLDDWSVRSQPATFHRLIAVIGDMRVKRGVAPLSAILQDKSEAELTKAYAANALGRIGERTAVDALASSLLLDDPMVRRQVAMALGRIDDAAAVPHLLRLRADSSVAVAEIATEAVQRWEQRTGRRLGARQRSPRPRAFGQANAPRRRRLAGPADRVRDRRLWAERSKQAGYLAIAVWQAVHRERQGGRRRCDGVARHAG